MENRVDTMKSAESATGSPPETPFSHRETSRTYGLTSATLRAECSLPTHPRAKWKPSSPNVTDAVVDTSTTPHSCAHTEWNCSAHL